MIRTLLSCCALSFLAAACSNASVDEPTGADVSPAQGSDGSSDVNVDETRIPLTVEEETDFCNRTAAMNGAICRVSTPSEPSPFKWTKCTDDALAPLKAQYFVPICSSDVPLEFKKTDADGTFRTVATANRAKYLACLRTETGLRTPRLEVFARAGTTVLTVGAYNPAVDAQRARAFVRYDNRAFAGSAPLLEVAIMALNPQTGAWAQTGRADLPNNQTEVTVDGYSPPNTELKLEVRGHRDLLGEPVATIVEARLSLPGTCVFDPISGVCVF